MMSDREKTAIDCIDRPALAGGVGEAASIFAAASRRFDWPGALASTSVRRGIIAVRISEGTRLLI